MDEQIIKYNNIDISNIEYSDPKKIGNIYYSEISYNDKPFFLQTSRMKNITDIKDFDLKKQFDLKFTIENSEMYNCLSKLDDNNINNISENSFEWFGKNIKIENSENMYRNITKPLHKNNKIIVNFKVPIINEEILCKIYNQDQIDININDISKDQECILIIHIRGIKFFKSYYICDYYITHIKTFSKLKYLIPDKCLIEDTSLKINDYEIIDEEALIEQKRKEKLKKKNLEKKKRELNRKKYLNVPKIISESTIGPSDDEIKKVQPKVDKSSSKIKLLSDEINMN